MTNADKMRELVGAPDAPNKVIHDWAYLNRIWLQDLPEEPEFTTMRASVRDYIAKHGYDGDEHVNWDGFLVAEYVPEEATK